MAGGDGAGDGAGAGAGDAETTETVEMVLGTP